MWLATVFLVYSKMEIPSETESITSRFEPYGAENSAVLSTLVASHPRADLLRNFLVILRYWAKVKGVSSRGNSINGYTLTLMAMVYLQNQGEAERAASLFSQTVAKVKRSPKHYRQAQQQWLDIAQAQLTRPPHDDTVH